MTIQQDRQKHSIRHQHRRKIEPEGENRPRYLAKSIDNPKQVVCQPFHPNLQPAIQQVLLTGNRLVPSTALRNQKTRNNSRNNI